MTESEYNTLIERFDSLDSLFAELHDEIEHNLHHSCLVIDLQKEIDVIHKDLIKAHYTNEEKSDDTN